MFDIGHVAIPNPGHVIHCGTGIYKWAIVINVSPFVLVSQHGDMIWEDEDPSDFTFVNVPTDTTDAVHRWKREQSDVKARAN
jgi:hypothetical protein